MAVVAIDPGKTTGYVIADSPFAIAEAGDAIRIENVIEILALLKRMNQLEVVVCESFSLYAGKKDAQSFADMPSSQIIGMLKEWCRTNEVRLEMQSPAARKLVTKEMFKATPFAKATRGLHHAKDAAQHLLLYYLRQEEWQKPLWDLFEQGGLTHATNLDTE